MENIILTNNKELRLVGVKVGVLSTLRFELPLVSASATRVEVIVTSGSVHSAYTATFIDNTKCWQCDIAASQFPAVGKQSYEIAYVLDGKQFWDGKGWIEIEDATTSGIEPQPRPEPYRYVVVSVNGYGADAQGAVRIPKMFVATDSPVTTEGYMEGDIYFNKDTGATWTLCDVSGTLVWVFNYSNYYTKAETDEQIDRVAAYYITYDAQGNSFPTRAALLNAQTYYSGGAPRTPTRNDYAVVLADETHDGAEWRYIYAVADGQTTGQWEPQYPVDGVIILDNSVTRTSANGVKSSGIWGAIWGALASLPTGFTSLYDWCVSQLAGKASTADATLAERYGSTETAQWTITYPQEWAHGTVSITWFDEFSPIGWVADCDGDRFGPFSENPNATTLTGEVFGETITATRTALPGYQLGSQSDKPLASEAEAEALRTGKADKPASFTEGNLAKFDASGNPTDSGVKASDKLDSASAAPAFSSDSSVSYAVGSHCTHQGKLYKCTTATTGGTWVAGSWTADTMTDIIPYDRITITTGQLQDHAEQKVTLNAATTTLSLPALTDLTGKVSDFGIDVVNGYEVSGTPTAASFSLAGTIGTDYNLIVPEGEDWSEMSALAAGEMAVYYFTLSAFAINDKPTWEVMKKVVELVPVPTAP